MSYNRCGLLATSPKIFKEGENTISNYKDLNSHVAVRTFITARQYKPLEARSMHFEKQDQCKKFGGNEHSKMNEAFNRGLHPLSPLESTLGSQNKQMFADISFTPLKRMDKGFALLVYFMHSGKHRRQILIG